MIATMPIGSSGPLKPKTAGNSEKTAGVFAVPSFAKLSRAQDFRRKRNVAR
jgi:hypothetical protein